MFFERLMNQTDAPILEQVLDFASTRHKLILENISNIDVAGYQQKDLSVAKFQGMLSKRLEDRNNAPAGSVGFDDLRAEIEHPNNGILSHDGNNRSMESLMSDLAKTGLMHNMVIELLRKQFQQMEMALKERVT